MAAPGDVRPTVEETIEAGDGTRLHLERFDPAGPARFAVIGVHGYSSHCGLYRHVGGALAGAGGAVLFFDCRGHGRSAGKRGYVSRFAHFVEDLDLLVQRHRRAHPAAPLFLLGHSHGGTIVLDYVLRGGGRADGLVIAAPYLALFMKPPRFKVALAPVVSRLWPTLAMANGIRPQDISRNPLVQQGFDRDPLVHHVATARWFREVLGVQAAITALAPRLTTPTLMLVAGDDRLVSSDAARAFAQAAGPAVELREYPGLFHELFLEPEADTVISDVVAWTMARARPTRILQVSP